MSQKKGFTLVELLVVISIIALLLSILMPALGAARRQAVNIQCSARIKQISQAALTWATKDSKGRLPRGGFHGYGAPFNKDWDDAIWMGAEDYFKIAAGLVNYPVSLPDDSPESADDWLDKATVEKLYNALHVGALRKLFVCPTRKKMKYWEDPFSQTGELVPEPFFYKLDAFC